jgi:hypothetical protein
MNRDDQAAAGAARALASTLPVSPILLATILNTFEAAASCLRLVAAEHAREHLRDVDDFVSTARAAPVAGGLRLLAAVAADLSMRSDQVDFRESLRIYREAVCIAAKSAAADPNTPAIDTLRAALRAYQDAATAALCAYRPEALGDATAAAFGRYLALSRACDDINTIVAAVHRGASPVDAVRSSVATSVFVLELAEALRDDLLARLSGEPGQIPEFLVDEGAPS